MQPQPEELPYKSGAFANQTTVFSHSQGFNLISFESLPCDRNPFNLADVVCIKVWMSRTNNNALQFMHKAMHV